MIGGPACRGWHHRKAQVSQIELVHEDVDHPRRVIFRHVVIKAAGKQRRLPAVFTFDEAGHLITPNLATSGAYGASRFYTASTQSRPKPIRSYDLNHHRHLDHLARGVEPEERVIGLGMAGLRRGLSRPNRLGTVGLIIPVTTATRWLSVSIRKSSFPGPVASKFVRQYVRDEPLEKPLNVAIIKQIIRFIQSSYREEYWEVRDIRC